MSYAQPPPLANHHHTHPILPGSCNACSSTPSGNKPGHLLNALALPPAHAWTGRCAPSSEGCLSTHKSPTKYVLVQFLRMHAPRRLVLPPRVRVPAIVCAHRAKSICKHDDLLTAQKSRTEASGFGRRHTTHFSSVAELMVGACVVWPVPRPEPSRCPGHVRRGVPFCGSPVVIFGRFCIFSHNASNPTTHTCTPPGATRAVLGRLCNGSEVLDGCETLPAPREASMPVVLCGWGKRHAGGEGVRQGRQATAERSRRGG